MLLYRRPDEYDLERFGDEDDTVLPGRHPDAETSLCEAARSESYSCQLATLPARILIIYSSLPTAIIRETAKCVRPQLRPLRVYN